MGYICQFMYKYENNQIHEGNILSSPPVQTSFHKVIYCKILNTLKNKTGSGPIICCSEWGGAHDLTVTAPVRDPS